MAVKEKIKKVLKWIALPFIFVGILLLKKLSLKKDSEIKKDLKDLNKQTNELKKDTAEAGEHFEDTQKKLDEAISSTEQTLDQSLSNKEERDKAAEQFFR